MIHVLVFLAFYSNVCGARRILYLPTEALSGGGGGGAQKRRGGGGGKKKKGGGGGGAGGGGGGGGGGHLREVWEGVSNY